MQIKGSGVSDKNFDTSDMWAWGIFLYKSYPITNSRNKAES